MENKKLGQEPAFPTSEFGNTIPIDAPQQGMSKRFYAACAAMQGLLHNVNSYSIIRNGKTLNTSLVEDAYKFADELLKQENNEIL